MDTSDVDDMKSEELEGYICGKLGSIVAVKDMEVEVICLGFTIRKYKMQPLK